MSALSRLLPRTPLPVAALLLAMLAGSGAKAFSPSCLLGGKCIKSQGTSIPSARVIEMMERCDEFTANGVGRQVLRMSLQEIISRSNGNPAHPVYAAYHAFGVLHDSPLAFKRRPNAEDTSYDEIAAACRRLSADFDRWAK